MLLKKMFEGFRCVKPLARSGSIQQLPGAKKRSHAAASQSNSATVPAAKRPVPPADAASRPVQTEGLLEKLGDQPLRLVIIGHNPSDHAWSSGHYYSNPNNWMWRILRETGIAPEAVRGPEDDGLMQELAGVGFTDVGTGHPGTQSSQFKSKHFDDWRAPFFQRLRHHTQRACASMGCRCECCGAPRIVAFAGKRQFQELFQGAVPKSRKGSATKAQQQGQRQQGLHGEQRAAEQGQQGQGEAGSSGEARAGDAAELPEAASTTAASTAAGGGAAAEAGTQAGAPGTEAAAAAAASSPLPPWAPPRLQRQRPAEIPIGRQGVLPEGWPLPLDSTEVWVMPSTSGAAAMTREQRVGPWRQLAERLQREPWPKGSVAACCQEEEEAEPLEGA